MAGPAVAAPADEAGTPSSNAAGAAPKATTTTALPGASRNLGGIDIDDYDDSLPKAAAAQGYDVVSIITDYPTRLRTLMEERGLKLPKAYEVKE